jgi:hypothetical protein
MSELRVPTLEFPAEAACADGRTFVGRIFVPATASHHSGAMRAEEWINEDGRFFPFLPDDASGSVLLNKQDVVVLSVAASADRDELAEDLGVPVRRVVVECGSRRLEGKLTIEMPLGQARVLDYLNRPEPFLILCDAERHHLVRKSSITRVVELPEA